VYLVSHSVIFLSEDSSSVEKSLHLSEGPESKYLFTTGSRIQLLYVMLPVFWVTNPLRKAFNINLLR
jgi:hypothetical protein